MQETPKRKQTERERKSDDEPDTVRKRHVSLLYQLEINLIISIQVNAESAEKVPTPNSAEKVIINIGRLFP